MVKDWKIIPQGSYLAHIVREMDYYSDKLIGERFRDNNARIKASRPLLERTSNRQTILNHYHKLMKYEDRARGWEK